MDVKARYDAFSDAFEVAILFDGGVVTDMTLTDFEPGFYVQPIFKGPKAQEFLRAALNAAWNAGLRPDGFMDTRESMKSVNAHLQDMRAIAFHKVGAAKP